MEFEWAEFWMLQPKWQRIVDPLAMGRIVNEALAAMFIGRSEHMSDDASARMKMAREVRAHLQHIVAFIEVSLNHHLR